MKMALDNAAGVNTITSYTPGRVGVRERHFSNSLIVLPRRLLTDWAPSAAHDLRTEHLQAVIELNPEILILGTGERQVFPDPRVFSSLMDLGIGFEVMDNAAACRTYNILLAEERHAALALLIAGND